MSSWTFTTVRVIAAAPVLPLSGSAMRISVPALTPIPADLLSQNLHFKKKKKESALQQDAQVIQTQIQGSQVLPWTLSWHLNPKKDWVRNISPHLYEETDTQGGTHLRSPAESV